MAARSSPGAAPRAAPASPYSPAATTIAGQAGSAGHRPEHRLRSPADFTRVFRTGRRRQDAFFTVIIAPGTAGGARLGIAVSRKTARSAVVRNRIRRQVRETFRQRRAKLAELDVVVMARPGAATVPARVLADSLSNFFDRMAQACDASQSH